MEAKPKMHEMVVDKIIAQLKEGEERHQVPGTENQPEIKVKPHELEPTLKYGR